MDILSVQQQKVDATTVKETTEKRARISVRSTGEGVAASEARSVDSTTHISARENPLQLVEKLSLEELQELLKPYLGEDV
ncbi:MAG: hypothetical protein GY950_06760, partial [bacterium]|nr:hypothetical protein [bacterium]